MTETELARVPMPKLRMRRETPEEAAARDTELRVRYRCLTCLDDGYVNVGSEAHPCPDCYEQRRAEMLWASSGLGELDRRFTLALFRPVPGAMAGLVAAQAMIAGKSKPWLVLLGPNGAGKTHLAKGICLARLTQLQPVSLWSVVQLLDWWRAGYAEEQFDVRFRGTMMLPFLVLDDLGRQRTTDWAGERLEELVDWRHGRELPTVLTANAERLANLSSATQSRLRDRRVCEVVTLNALDYRMKINDPER